jgi:FMN phosphatase YigB (HAD superfamily)
VTIFQGPGGILIRVARSVCCVRVFLDLWGVLLDSDKMQDGYGRELARRMAARFGGPEDGWLRAHTAAWTDYVREVESTDWSAGSWAATVDRLDARFAVSILERVGISWRPADPLSFSRELERNVMARVDARFPDARVAVERLHSAGHGVYVATQATDSNARGALAGAGLLTAIDGLFTGTSQDAPKSRREYWDRALATLGASAGSCILVDDRADYLEAAAAAGFEGLLLDREALFGPETTPPFVRATLRNLAGLPHFVDTLEAERRRTSA